MSLTVVKKRDVQSSAEINAMMKAVQVTLRESIKMLLSDSGFIVDGDACVIKPKSP